VRGDEEQPESLIVFCSLEDRVPADHPVLAIRAAGFAPAQRPTDDSFVEMFVEARS